MPSWSRKAKDSDEQYGTQKGGGKTFYLFYQQLIIAK
jgi:hypothetical protein